MGERKSKLLPTPYGSKPTLRVAIAPSSRDERSTSLANQKKTKEQESTTTTTTTKWNVKEKQLYKMYTVLLILSSERERER